ncbi:MAG: LOG family protein [Candidatus Gastranaerophilaceae bacterium]
MRIGFNLIGQNIVFGNLVKGNEADFPTNRLVAAYLSGKALEGSDTWIKSEELGKTLAKENIGVTMGAGERGGMGGIAKGIREAGGYVVGITTDVLKKFEGVSPYLNELHIEEHDNEMHARMVKYDLRSRPDVVIAAPGGQGTLDEIVKKWCKFELKAMTTNDATPKEKIILYGKDYWQGFLNWLKGPVKDAGNISERRLGYFELADTPQEVVKIIKRVMSTVR